MPKELRRFIPVLGTKSPENLALVTRIISARYEISSLLTHLEKKKRFPLLYFETVEGGRAHVVINAQASRRLMAKALECEPHELAKRFSERQAAPIAPVEVSHGPVHELIQLGDDVDL